MGDQNNRISEVTALIERIQSFATLEENWDSYGAKPIDQDCIEQAIEYVRCQLGLCPNLPYAVVPTNTGGVEFEWMDGRTYRIEPKS